MPKRTLNNKTLDMIGRRLVEIGLSDPNIVEEIVSKPDLFASVTKRIEANETASLSTQSGFFVLSYLRRNAAVFAGVASLFVIIVWAANLLRSDEPFVTVNPIQAPETLPDIARPVFPPQGMIVGKLSPGRAFIQETAEKKPAKQVVKIASQKVKNDAPREPEGEFYALSAAYNQEEAAGGRIVRVDVSRSSLFALGVNIPLENDAEVVKADLLIGSDGAAHAIRVVK